MLGLSPSRGLACSGPPPRAIGLRAYWRVGISGRVRDGLLPDGPVSYRGSLFQAFRYARSRAWGPRRMRFLGVHPRDESMVAASWADATESGRTV